MTVRELTDKGVEDLVNATIEQLQIDVEDGRDDVDVRDLLRELIRDYSAQEALIRYIGGDSLLDYK